IRHVTTVGDSPFLQLAFSHGKPQLGQQHFSGHTNTYLYLNKSCTAAAMRAASGTWAVSNGFENGTALNAPPKRRTGAFNRPCSCSVISAAISAPTPKLRTASCTITARPVLLTDLIMVSASNGAMVRKSTTSADIPCWDN